MIRIWRELSVDTRNRLALSLLRKIVADWEEGLVPSDTSLSSLRLSHEGDESCLFFASRMLSDYDSSDISHILRNLLATFAQLESGEITGEYNSTLRAVNSPVIKRINSILESGHQEADAFLSFIVDENPTPSQLLTWEYTETPESKDENAEENEMSTFERWVKRATIAIVVFTVMAVSATLWILYTSSHEERNDGAFDLQPCQSHYTIYTTFVQVDTSSDSSHGHTHIYRPTTAITYSTSLRHIVLKGIPSLRFAEANLKGLNLSALRPICLVERDSLSVHALPEDSLNSIPDSIFEADDADADD